MNTKNVAGVQGLRFAVVDENNLIVAAFVNSKSAEQFASEGENLEAVRLLDRVGYLR